MLIAIANTRNGGRLISAAQLHAIGFNDGGGLGNQSSCDRLADALERLLKHPATIREHGMEVGKDEEGEYIGISADDSSLLCDKDGHLYTKEDARKRRIALTELRSAYQASMEQVREFIAFLRNCGGFKVG